MARARRITPHLFAQWDRIVRRFRKTQRIVMFLDFDGTLVRIAPLPHGVRLEEGTRDALQRLARHRNVTVVVISGRQRAELQQYVGLRKLKYLGLYGWETSGNRKAPFPVRVILARVLVEMMNEFRAFPGVWIEPKRNTFSVHLKGASGETRRKVRHEVMNRVKPLRETLRVMSNLRDLEVAPVSIGDKGVAVRKLLDEPALRGALPIYFGDDFSDEPAFDAARKGISVLVGKRRATRARYCLRGPAEVAVALSRMEEIIP